MVEGSLQALRGFHMLKVENLSVSYGYIAAFRGVSLEIHQEEIVALIGGNSADKTTTLMAISNLLEKEGGRVIFKGDEITCEPPHRIVRMRGPFFL